MATLILFGAINIALDGNEPYRIEVAENLEAAWRSCGERHRHPLS